MFGNTYDRLLESSTREVLKQLVDDLSEASVVAKARP
jgi:hypothetical protein